MSRGHHYEGTKNIVRSLSISQLKPGTKLYAQAAQDTPTQQTPASVQGVTDGDVEAAIREFEKHCVVLPATWNAVRAVLIREHQEIGFKEAYQLGWNAALSFERRDRITQVDDTRRKDLLTAAFCVAGVGDPNATLRPGDAERIIDWLLELASHQPTTQEQTAATGEKINET